MMATSSLSGCDRTSTPNPTQSCQQVYKGHLMIPRYSRSWWWVTVIDPHGNDLKDRGFSLSEGQPSMEQALSQAQRLIDTLV